MKAAKRSAGSALDRLAERVARMPDGQRERLAAYLDAGPPVSEQLRLAIDASGVTRYALWKATGIDQAQLSRFMAGEAGLSLTAIDRICAVLGLRLTAAKRRKKGGGG